MGNETTYHTFEEYNRQGIRPFLDHIRDYCAHLKTVPVCKPNIVGGNPAAQEVTFTYVDEMLKKNLDRRNNMIYHRAHDAAMRFGMKGYSTGEQNGIFFLRIPNHDIGLDTQLERLIKAHETEIKQDLDILEGSLDDLRRVKIVWHSPQGERVLGVYKPNAQPYGRIIFLGVGMY